MDFHNQDALKVKLAELKTQRREIEAKLALSNKLEAVGALPAGISPAEELEDRFKVISDAIKAIKSSLQE